MKKLAVLFPGIGYTCDMPLFYYIKKVLRERKYDISEIKYDGFSVKIKGDEEKIKETFFKASQMIKDQLMEIPFNEYDEVVFISKSIGTVVSNMFITEAHLNYKSVLMTPIKQTFDYGTENSIVMHGLKDPWAKSEDVIDGCNRKNIKFYTFDNANHSLETGVLDENLDNIKRVVEIVSEYIK